MRYSKDTRSGLNKEMCGMASFICMIGGFIVWTAINQ